MKEIDFGISAHKSLYASEEAGFGRIQQIVCGEDHSLLRDVNGDVYAWGANHKGQLGNGTYFDEWKPSLVETLPLKIRDIASCGD